MVPLIGRRPSGVELEELLEEVEEDLK